MTEEGTVEVRYVTTTAPYDASALDFVKLIINVHEVSTPATTLTNTATAPTTSTASTGVLASTTPTGTGVPASTTNASPTSYTFYPDRFSLGRGMITEPFDGNLNEVQRLKTQESTLGMTLEQKNVEAGVYIFDSNQTVKGLDFRMTFNLGSNLPIRDAITSLSFKATFMGSQGDWNVWQFFVKNFDTNEEELLTSNLLANDWVWSELSGTKVISLGSSYVNVAGEIIISFVTNGPVGTFDASALDFVQLTVNTNEGQPTSTTAPAATTVPTDSVPTAFTAYKFTPTKLVLSKGKITEPFDGNLNELQRLKTKEATLGQTLDQTNVEAGVYMFDSNQTSQGLDFLMTFNVGSKRSIRTAITSISLTARFIGSQGDWNIWQFFIKNFKKNKQEVLASNAAANDWTWSDLTGNITFKYLDSSYMKENLTGNITFKYLDSSYMKENGDIEVSYVTNGPPGTFDASSLDFVEITVHINEPRPERPELPPKPSNPPKTIASKQLPWTTTARLCGLSTNPTFTEQIMKASVDQKKNEHCSVIEVDSGLSIYHTDAEFATQLSFLNSLSTYAEQQGLKTVIYIPTLETNVPGGCNNGQPTAISMALTKPDWLQTNLEGQINYFCGAQEVWVENGMESAWFDPNNPDYRSHFLTRVTALAQNTKLCGLWGDVPIFSDTFGSWSGGGPHSKAKFVAWASEKNFDYTDLPTISDANTKAAIFNAWIQWRHETLDEWQESILLAGEAGNPDFIFAAEIYSVDYLDGYWIGLDGGFKKNSKQFR
eukprot:Awhi_evm1s7335